MGEMEKEFRNKISKMARIQNVQNSNQIISQDLEKKENYKDFSKIMPAICGVKKSIENFRNSTKELEEER